jgi:hypothetical protein
MLQVFHLDVSKVDRGVGDSHVTTACGSSLGIVHTRGGTEGWSAAWQQVWEAKDDGGKGTGNLHAACGCGKRRGCVQTEARNEGHSFL